MISDKFKISQIRNSAGYILPLILTVFFLYLAFQNVDIAESLNLISNISITWFLIFLLVFSFSHLLRAIRWQVILWSVKKDTSLLNLLGSLMIGYGVNCVVPRLGEVYRGLFAGRWENLSRSSMLGTIILERIIDLLALIFAVLVSVMIYQGDLFEKIQWLKSTIFIGFSAMFVIIIFLIALVKLKEKFYSGILRFLGKISQKLAEKVAYIFSMLTEGFSSIKSLKQFTVVLILSAAIIIVYGLTSYLAFYMLRMDAIQEVTFSMGWIVMTIAAFGIVIPTPGGTGSYHALVIFVLVSIYNFSEEVAGAYALLTHFVSYVAFIGSTLFAIYFINRRHSNKGGQKENFLSVFKIKPGEK